MPDKSPYDLDPFTRAYVECALWSSLSDGGDYLDGQYSIEDLAPETIQKAEADCKRFGEANGETFFGAYMVLWEGSHDEFASRMGHDFWLSRNGHGSGYFDEGLGKPYNSVWDKLQDAARAFGEIDLYPGDDGKLYFS